MLKLLVVPPSSIFSRYLSIIGSNFHVHLCHFCPFKCDMEFLHNYDYHKFEYNSTTYMYALCACMHYMLPHIKWQ